jgi:UDP-glucuronate 4-epimerase
MTTLVTGAAGFIGYHVSHALLKKGEKVIGVDNMNPYYDVRLKEARLEQLKQYPNFTFHQLNIADRNSLSILTKNDSIQHIVHLAAQAGVRYSLENPYAYADSNLVGHLNILEVARHIPSLQHMVYASSSSVYGANQKLPFSVHDPVEQPLSLYAASKRACELMSYTYSHLYNIPATGLRFFTVYGPWGRPDMAAYIFTKALFDEKEIPVFNNGDMRRNFTYINDIVNGILGCLKNPPSNLPPHKVYNIGNSQSESLMNYIQVLERLTGKKANLRFEALQPGDVKETIADITDTTRDFGFIPTTNIEEGLGHFVEWYKTYHKIF